MSRSSLDNVTVPWRRFRRSALNGLGDDGLAQFRQVRKLRRRQGRNRLVHLRRGFLLVRRGERRLDLTFRGGTWRKAVSLRRWSALESPEARVARALRLKRNRG